MVEQELILEPCCKCGKFPTIRKENGGLFYAQCTCGKWNPYEALGASRKGAIIHWNDLNRPIKRTGNPKEMRDEM